MNRPAPRDRGEKGQALLEFVITFPIVVFLVLAVLEFAHYANVVQLAQYAAFAAARAQISHDRDTKAAEKAAALAMAPFAESSTAFVRNITADAPARSSASSVASSFVSLSDSGQPYASGNLFGAEARIQNSFNWQTWAWMGFYGSDDKQVTQSNKSYSYVKAGVCFTYPLRVQSLAVLSALIVRAKDRQADDDKASSLFGGAATNAMTPPTDKDWWARAEKISSASGLVVVPVVQGCILGR